MANDLTAFWAAEEFFVILISFLLVLPVTLLCSLLQYQPDCQCGRTTDVDASYERTASEVTSVGIARANIRNVPASSEVAAGLVQARLREELKYAAQKTARADVESDRV